MNHDPGFHLGCDEHLSKGWGPPLYKTEVIRRRGPWRHLEAVECATLEWGDWFNHRRLLAPIGHVPPAECEQQYYLTQEAPVMAAGVN